jgi:RND superfamily putative drug exporter
VTRLGAFVFRRRRRVLAGAAVLFVLAAGLGGPVAGELEGAGLHDPDSESFRAAGQIAQATRGQVDFGLVALGRPGGDVRTDAAARDRLRSIQRAIAADPGITATRSWLDTRDPGFVSRDGREAMILAAFGADELSVAERLRAQLGPQGVRFGGSDLADEEIGDQVSKDLARAELLAFPLLFALSMWVFRGVVAALMPPLVGALSIVITFLLMRIVNSEVTSLSIYALNLVTAIGLGLAIDYSLFVVSRYREETARLGYGREALQRTLATAGRTILFSALTVAAAMAALLVFPLQFLYSMGIGGVLASLVAAAVALTILPAVLAALGPRVNALSPRRWQRAADATARPVAAGPWYRLAQAVMRRALPVALVTSALLIVAGLPFLRATFVSTDWRMLPPGSEARQVAETLERDFDTSASQPIMVVASATRADDRRVTAYSRRLATLPGGRVAPPQRLGPSTVVLYVLAPGDALGPGSRDLVRAIRDVPAPFALGVTGDAARFVDQQAALVAWLPLALALLATTTFAILFLMTGSVVLPVKALLMNLLTLSATFGTLVLLFQDGRLEGLLSYRSPGGIESTQPVLLFVIAFGLATDYGVFLLSRIKEARDAGLEDREAVAFGVERTGRIVTAAALLFCVAVGAFATSSIVFIKMVGLGTALAVAIDATIIRALLVPALMALLGRWNWWAPAPLRWLHARVGLSEAGA